jgi:2-dehydro-3-deoxyphosphogalactonate aldolase
MSNPGYCPVSLPLVAILRGLRPEDAPAFGNILFGAGFRLLEVPLNRPGAIEAIRALIAIAPADAVVGGGTMLTREHVDSVFEVGGRLFVSPNCNPGVIAHAASLGMLCAPGVATPTEAFAALDAGANVLKIFPAETIGLAGLKAMKTVLPDGTDLWPVGGISPDHIGNWRNAGATGAGIGSQLYTDGVTVEQLRERALSFVAAWNKLAPVMT